nr:solute carrier family 25 member 44 [Quercus suber]
MNLSATEEESPSTAAAAAKEVHIPAEIDWEMLDKSKFFFLGAALFSSVSGMLYPIVVLKTRQQVAQSEVSCIRTAFWIVRNEGFRALYRGFGTSLTGTIPAQALYMTTLEITKSNVGSATVRLGVPEPTAATVANAAAGLSAAMAAQLVWTPIDVVSQRLMVQGSSRGCGGNLNSRVANVSACKYANGIDAFRKILNTDGPRGLYRGFGISILTYAPSNAVWWASYSIAQRMVWSGFGYYFCKKDERANNQNNLPPPSTTMIGHHESGTPTRLSKTRSSQLLEYLRYKSNWIEETRGAFMVVATVITTITYQPALSPPGRVWQTDLRNSNETKACLNRTCEAGTLVLAYAYENLFLNFLVCNTIAFTASLSVIFFLIIGFPLKNKFFMGILAIAMCTTLTFLGITYVLALAMLIPEHLYLKLGTKILIPIGVWACLILLVILIHTNRSFYWLVCKICKFVLTCAKVLTC